MDGGEVICPARAAAGTHNVFDVDAADHPLCGLLGGRVTQIIAERNQRLVAVAAVEVDVGVHILDKNLKEHVCQALRLAAVPVAWEDAVEVLAVLEDAGHSAVFKARAVGQRDDDHAAVQRRDVEFLGELDGGLDADVFRIVDACGNEYGRPRLPPAEQDVRDMQFGALHMDMIFDGFAGCQFVPGDGFELHGGLQKRFSPVFYTLSSAGILHNPPGGMQNHEKPKIISPPGAYAVSGRGI